MKNYERLRKFLYSHCFTKKICEYRILFREWLFDIVPIYITRLLNRKTAFLVLTPDHGNMGDHAIAEAESALLDEAGISFREITYNTLLLLERHHALNIMNGRCIVVNGGGNLGTLWFPVERLFRRIIKENPRSFILCMPNTIYYEDNNWAQSELELSRKVYNAHAHLKLYAREQSSFLLMDSLYNDVTLVPDVVLSMDKSQDQVERNGCLLCLRHDIERTRNDEQEAKIIEVAHKIFGTSVAFTDMDVGHQVPLNARLDTLEKKYNEFKQSKLVITDRLHGMIFAAITGTPCIVLDSKSPKLRGCYKWVADLNYIRFADSPQEIEVLYRAIPCEVHHYENQKLRPYFQHLKEDLRLAIKNV